ncbi:MAG: hypothetical protein ACR2QC_00645 [Gammaproteobacteria bacterium]
MTKLKRKVETAKVVVHVEDVLKAELERVQTAGEKAGYEMDFGLSNHMTAALRGYCRSVRKQLGLAEPEKRRGKKVVAGNGETTAVGARFN